LKRATEIAENEDKRSSNHAVRRYVMYRQDATLKDQIRYAEENNDEQIAAKIVAENSIEDCIRIAKKGYGKGYRAVFWPVLLKKEGFKEYFTTTLTREAALALTKIAGGYSYWKLYYSRLDVPIEEATSEAKVKSADLWLELFQRSDIPIAKLIELANPHKHAVWNNIAQREDVKSHLYTLSPKAVADMAKENNSYTLWEVFCDWPKGVDYLTKTLGPKEAIQLAKDVGEINHRLWQVIIDRPDFTVDQVIMCAKASADIAIWQKVLARDDIAALV
jgi:hypothetical protein